MATRSFSSASAGNYRRKIAVALSGGVDSSVAAYLLSQEHGIMNDIVGIHMIDPREEELPNVGLIRAVDSESGITHWVDTSMPSVREEYAASFQKNYNYFKTTFLKSGADTISIYTDKPYINALLKFFKKRSK